MVFEHIEKLKRQYTDKYVVVDDSRPELRRFRGLTGTVKTVNMNGRLLVQFDGHNNIGWYDIDPAYLKVVEAPLPKPAAESKREKEKAPPKAEAKPAKPPATPATTAPAKPPSPAAGKSVAEILAAARKPAGAAASATPAPSSPAAPTSATPAGAVKSPPGKVPPGGKGMTLEEILAAARGKGGAAKPVATPSQPTVSEAPPPPATTAAPPSAASEAASPPLEAAPAAPSAAPAGAPLKVPPGGKGMTLEEILALARRKPGEAAPPASAAPAPAAKTPPNPPSPKPAAPPAPPRAEAPAAEEPAGAAEVSEAAVATESSAAGGPIRSLKDQITSVAEQIAYCRKVDRNRKG